MPDRRMFIVAGPPGAGKSSLFALSDFARNVFSADDRAAQFNGGSYERIPLPVRAIVNLEFEEFVHANIRCGASFALETTLRSKNHLRSNQARVPAAPRITTPARPRFCCQAEP